MVDKLKKYKDYKTVLSVGALIWCKGKILLLKRSESKIVNPGLYSGIGGKVEPGESVYEALAREIEEETGIKEFYSMKPYSITQHADPSIDCEWVNMYFSVEIKTPIKVPQSIEGEFHWIDPKDIDNLPMVTDQKEFIKILTKDKDAFILSSFKYDDQGKLLNHINHILEHNK